MKKVIIIIFLLFPAALFAQSKKVDTIKKDTIKRIDPLLKIVISHEKAAEVLKSLQTGYAAMSTSETITANDFTTSKTFYEFLIDLIYKKWPDLKPNTR